MTTFRTVKNSEVVPVIRVPKPQDKAWSALESALTELLSVFNPIAFTVQFSSDDWEVAPYIQAEYFAEDDTFVIEITSNRYLRPSLTEHQEHQLRFLSWNQPDSNENPNFYRIFQNTVENRQEAAHMWVESLREVFGLSHRDEYRVSPHHLPAIEVLNQSVFALPALGHFVSYDWRAQKKAFAARAERIRKGERRPALAPSPDRIDAPKFRGILEQLGPLGEVETLLVKPEVSAKDSAPIAPSDCFLLMLGREQVAVLYAEGSKVRAAQKLHSAVVHFHPNVGRDFQIEVLRRFHAMGTFERVTFESMGYRDFDASLEYLQTRDWSEVFPDGACIYHKHMIQ